MHRLIAVGLHVFHRALARLQRFNLRLQAFDVLDFLIQCFDFSVQETVIRLLTGYGGLKPAVRQNGDTKPDQRR